MILAPHNRTELITAIEVAITATAAATAAAAAATTAAAAIAATFTVCSAARCGGIRVAPFVRVRLLAIHIDAATMRASQHHRRRTAATAQRSGQCSEHAARQLLRIVIGLAAPTTARRHAGRASVATVRNRQHEREPMGAAEPLWMC